MNRFYTILVLVLLCVLLKVCFSPSQETNPELKYESSWRSPDGEEFLKVGRVMAKHHLSWGEYRLKRRIDSDNEYRAACRIDTGEWHGYLIFTASQEVVPFNDPKVSMPQE